LLFSFIIRQLSVAACFFAWFDGVEDFFDLVENFDGLDENIEMLLTEF